MAVYCNPGEIARVILPDGAIQTYSNVPITVDCKPVYGSTCENLTVGLGYPGRYDNYVRIIGEITDVYPLDGWRYGLTYGIYRGGSQSGWICQNLEERGLIYNPWSYYVLSYIVYSHDREIWLKDERQGIDNPTSYQLTIKDKDELILLNQSYTNCNYLVECLEGCPPNHIKCDDGCCLDCEDVFYKLCNIKRLFI